MRAHSWTLGTQLQLCVHVLTDCCALNSNMTTFYCGVSPCVQQAKARLFCLLLFLLSCCFDLFILEVVYWGKTAASDDYSGGTITTLLHILKL